MPACGFRLASIIAQWEQYTYNAYCLNQSECSRGIWTAGFGSTFYLDGRKVKQGDTMGLSEAGQLLHNHLQDISAQVWALSGRRLNNSQLAALTSFSYNLGVGAFQRSTMRKLILEGRMEEAGKQILLFDKQKGVTLKGLTKRRQAEYVLWNTPPVACNK